MAAQAKERLEDPLDSTQLPAWNRIGFHRRDWYEQLLLAKNMIPRPVIGSIRGEVIPEAIWIGVRSSTGREWCRRVRVVFGRFVFLARLAGTYGAFIETHPLGKGRREIGTFEVPGSVLPVLVSDRRILNVRIQGEPQVKPSERDVIGLADADWNHAASGIGVDPDVELDRTYEWEKSDFDRVYLYRKNRQEVAWWPLDCSATELLLRYDDSVRVPKPRRIR